MVHADYILPKIMMQDFVHYIVERNCDKNLDFEVSTRDVS